MPNKHGLSRHIPTDVQREIRRRSKNGCVICRSLVYDYEHIEPEFAEAHEHNPDNICLLCPACHAEGTRGRLAKSQIRNAYRTVQESPDITPPFYRPELSGSLSLGLGDAVFDFMPQNASILEYDGEPILQTSYIRDTVFGGARPSITGGLFDVTGEELIRIDDNHITLQANGVDVTFVGDTLTITGPTATILLEMVLSPPNGIRFNRLRMRYGDVTIEMDRTFGISVPSIFGQQLKLLVSRIQSRGARAAISYISNPSNWNGVNLEISDKGICIPCSGARLAVGGSVLMPKIELLTS